MVFSEGITYFRKKDFKKNQGNSRNKGLFPSGTGNSVDY